MSFSFQDPASVVRSALVLVPVLPALVVAFVGAAMVVGRTPSERAIARLVRGALGIGLALATFATAVRFSTGLHEVDARLGSWFGVPGYRYEVSILVDSLSLTMVIVTGVISLLVARFSERYLHREPGYARFFLLLCTFVTGMQTLVLAGSYDLLFAGWELVGLASILLVAFFHQRQGPARAALRVMITYRVADVGLLVAGVLLHQAAGSSEFADAFGAGAWPHAATHLGTGAATVIALALLLSVMGKSAQFPLGGWLPRAMEGPTPSSALFYGALSVHAGVYLLLRSAPLLEISPVASFAVGLVGATTAVFATMVGRTQSDAKNALAYATMTQVGVMLVEIGLHLWWWALLHVVAHAFLRLLQLLRTPSALRDAQEVRAALARSPRPLPTLGARLLPAATLARLQHLALHRFFADESLERFVVAPVLGASRALDRLERRWANALSGWSAPPRPEPLPEAAEPARAHVGGGS